MKKCSKCKIEKPEIEFYKRRNTRLTSWCKGCQIIKAVAWKKANQEKARKAVKDFYARNPDKQRAWSRTRQLKKYGLTGADFLAMLVKQDNQCAICSKTLVKGNQTHIDHCHDTGKVRGLLCGHCNWALGFLNDSLDTLEKACEYLKQFPKAKR